MLTAELNALKQTTKNMMAITMLVTKLFLYSPIIFLLDVIYQKARIPGGVTRLFKDIAFVSRDNAPPETKEATIMAGTPYLLNPRSFPLGLTTESVQKMRSQQM